MMTFRLKHVTPLLGALSLAILAGCSGGSGQETVKYDDFSQNEADNSITYNGPSPTTDDVLNFKLNVWDNLAGSDRCGACHNDTVGQAPMFVRADDINQAYSAANSIVDLSIPGNSRMVEKVAGGHNCWSGEPDVCAEIITNYIEGWAGDSGAASNVIVLTAPEIKEVGTSRSFPPAAEGTGFIDLHSDILVPYCGSCHSETSALQQQPYLGSDDVDVAYDAARSKINLDSPELSRLVMRLRTDFHNCWDNCTANANEMQTAIEAFRDAIELTEVDPTLQVSAALGLPDGIVASSGGRVESNVIALYEFKNDSLEVAYDTSGVEPALNLNLTGNVERVGGWGIRINDGKAQGATSSSRKLYDMIRATGEFSIETWVVPDNVTQDGPARIVSYSGGSEIRNFTLGQTLYNYNFMNRNSSSDANGMPMVSTEDADEVLQATLQHVVTNYDPLNGTTIYVNGELVASSFGSIGTNINDWDDTFALALGNEVDDQHLWQGTIRFLAIHNRVLSEQDIVTNFDVGVGQKFYLLFSVSEHVDLPDSYIVFQVQQFDTYSYLFNEPFFISLGDQAPTSDIQIRGIRIGINGKEATVGQSFGNLEITVNADNYNAETGTPLSGLGAVIALEKGPDSDQFFLSFDQIGDSLHTRVEPDPAAPDTPADIEGQADIGLRNFEEIDATISRVTSVPRPRVLDFFKQVQQQLPTDENIQGFLAAHQSGVMQLTAAYCAELSGDTALRAAYFPSVDFSGSLTSANSAGVIDPLLSALVANDIDLGSSTASVGTQPDPAAVRAELNDLIDFMAAFDTPTTVTAVCSAAVGSSMMLLQ